MLKQPYLWGVAAVLVFVLAYYAFFLVPNFRQCMSETHSWRACSHWLVR